MGSWELFEHFILWGTRMLELNPSNSSRHYTVLYIYWIRNVSQVFTNQPEGAANVRILWQSIRSMLRYSSPDGPGGLTDMSFWFLWDCFAVRRLPLVKKMCFFLFKMYCLFNIRHGLLNILYAFQLLNNCLFRFCRYTCPFVEKFSIDIETYYKPDTGNQGDVFNMCSAEKRQRTVGKQISRHQEDLRLKVFLTDGLGGRHLLVSRLRNQM